MDKTGVRSPLDGEKNSEVKEPKKEEEVKKEEGGGATTENNNRSEPKSVEDLPLRQQDGSPAASVPGAPGVGSGSASADALERLKDLASSGPRPHPRERQQQQQQEHQVSKKETLSISRRF